MHEGTHSSWELWDFLLRVGLAERTNRAPVTQSSVITIAAIVRRLHTGVCVCVCVCVRVFSCASTLQQRGQQKGLRPWRGLGWACLEAIPRQTCMILFALRWASSASDEFDIRKNHKSCEEGPISGR